MYRNALDYSRKITEDFFLISLSALNCIPLSDDAMGDGGVEQVLNHHAKTKKPLSFPAAM